MLAGFAKFLTLELQIWVGVFERIRARINAGFVSRTWATSRRRELFFDEVRGPCPTPQACWQRVGPPDSDQRGRRPSTRGAPRSPTRSRAGYSGGDRAPPARRRAEIDRLESRRPGVPRVM